MIDELRELADDLAQLRLLDDLRGLVGGKPASLALSALGPYLRLLAHLQREDLDLAGDGGLRLQALVVAEAPDRPLADLAANARFLEGLALCRHVRLAVLHRPALRDDPALGLAGGDEHHLHAAVVDHLVGQRADLAAAFGGGFGVLVHRADLALPVAPRRFRPRQGIPESVTALFYVRWRELGTNACGIKEFLGRGTVPKRHSADSDTEIERRPRRHDNDVVERKPVRDRPELLAERRSDPRGIGARLEMEPLHEEAPRRPVGLEVDPRRDGVAEKERQHVIAVLA